MFPIRDHNPSERMPFVTYGLMAANIVIFLSYVALFSDARAINGFFATYALVPAEVSAGLEFQTLLTSMFLHGGWMHLAGNMLFLYIFGDNLEDAFGHLGFAAFYIMAGIGAGLVHVFIDPSSPVPTVGASGAIAGVMGGYLLLFPKARVDILLIIVVFVRIFPVPAWVMLGLWFAFQLFSGVTTTPGGGGVAYWAHVGGFVIGAILVIPVWLEHGGRGFWRQTHGHPPHPEARYPALKSRIPKVTRK